MSLKNKKLLLTFHFHSFPTFIYMKSYASNVFVKSLKKRA
jgi:hypothetical protein